jgi:hypothetical protein
MGPKEIEHQNSLHAMSPPLQSRNGKQITAHDIGSSVTKAYDGYIRS